MITNMKLRYIIPMFMAAVTMLVGCSEDEEKSTLSQIQVSQSVISLAAGEEADPADKEFGGKISGSLCSGKLVCAAVRLSNGSFRDSVIKLLCGGVFKGLAGVELQTFYYIVLKNGVQIVYLP